MSEWVRTHRPRWVRGKALQTVIGLRAIRTGDELLLCRCSNEDHYAKGDADFFGQVVRVTGIDDNPNWPIDIRADYRNYCTCWCGIKAWRRPISSQP